MKPSPKEMPPAPPAQSAREPLEAIGKRLGTPAWLIAATRASQGWAIGREVTEAEFLSAATTFSSSPIGYSPRE